MSKILLIYIWNILNSICLLSFKRASARGLYIRLPFLKPGNLLKWQISVTNFARYLEIIEWNHIQRVPLIKRKYIARFRPSFKLDLKIISQPLFSVFIHKLYSIFCAKERSENFQEIFEEPSSPEKSMSKVWKAQICIREHPLITWTVEGLAKWPFY